jgi:hypothetical protein
MGAHGGGERARPTFSKVRGGLRIGKTFFARRGLVSTLKDSARPRGVVDTMSALAHPGMDPARVHPDVAVFFTDTESLELFVRSTWRFPFSLLWLLYRPIFKLIGQFVLPRHTAQIHTQVLPMNTAADGRDDARIVLRTYQHTGDTMQAVAYATWQRGQTRFMSAAFPLPFCQLTGLLRLDPASEGAGNDAGVTLTSRSQRGDDAGVYMVVGPLAFRTPFSERFSLWPASSSVVSNEAYEKPSATIIGVHEQYFLGLHVVTHHYWFRPRAS